MICNLASEKSILYKPSLLVKTTFRTFFASIGDQYRLIRKDRINIKPKKMRKKVSSLFCHLCFKKSTAIDYITLLFCFSASFFPFYFHLFRRSFLLKVLICKIQIKIWFKHTVILYTGNLRKKFSLSVSFNSNIMILLNADKLSLYFKRLCNFAVQIF